MSERPSRRTPGRDRELAEHPVREATIGIGIVVLTALAFSVAGLLMAAVVSLFA